MILDNASSHVLSFAKVGKSRGFSTFGSRYNNIFQKLVQEEIFAVGDILSQYDDATLKDLRKVMPNIRQTIIWSYEV